MVTAIDSCTSSPAVVNGGLETGYKRPSEDVTGTIDLTQGAVTMHVVLATKVHFEAGCTIVGCVIKEDRAGTLTADITGTIHLRDTDRDWVPDRSDNCPFVANPAQEPVATPVVTPPFNITLHTCTDHRIGLAIGADVCFGGPVIVTNDAPPRFAIGPNVVMWMAEDANHHTATATQTVTIIDTVAPLVSCVATNRPEFLRGHGVRLVRRADHPPRQFRHCEGRDDQDQPDRSARRRAC